MQSKKLNFVGIFLCAKFILLGICRPTQRRKLIPGEPYTNFKEAIGLNNQLIGILNWQSLSDSKLKSTHSTLIIMLNRALRILQKSLVERAAIWILQNLLAKKY
jgi:cystathionine beta-lyase family protein involved in aluminum resistance